MFRRKLTALDYHNPSGFNCKDETEFRNFIVWLEDQKIRHYKIEDRGNLRNIHSSDWPKFFEKYLKDVNCPFKIQDRQEAIDWLLGLAVRLEYGDNAEKYKDLVPDNRKNTDNAAKNAEPLINLDVNNPDFKAGVMALANLLQIQRHDDYLVMLKAIRILVQERLTQDAVAKANQTKEGLPVALEKHILGFDTGDAVLNEAAQILRLLHIEELRELPSDGNHYTSMCLEIRCHTWKGEPQEIDHVLEIYHRCFFFNKVGEVKGAWWLLFSPTSPLSSWSLASDPKPGSQNPAYLSSAQL